MIHVAPLFRSRLWVSHGDARLDLTDLYAFPKPGDAGKSILIMNGAKTRLVIHAPVAGRSGSGLRLEDVGDHRFGGQH
jgi:hypothetical protein